MIIPDPRPRLHYLATNENLLAIRHGLALSPDDEVLSIAGAGDQALSMLEFVKKVVVVDSNPKQLAYLTKQASLISQGDFLSFLKPDILLKSDDALGFDVGQLEAFNELGLAQRKKYFTRTRLHTIQAAIDHLVISSDSVMDAFDGHRFNKAYLTNIVGYHDSDFTRGSLLFVGVNHIVPGGLLYISNANKENDYMVQMKTLGLEREEDLTAVARSLEPNWRPDVFKRVR